MLLSTYSQRPADPTELVMPFVRSLQTVCDTMLDCAMQAGPLRPVTAVEELAAAVGARIEFSGGLNGELSIHASENAALAIFEQMIGYRPASLDDDVRDALGEITNMTAGYGKRELADLGLLIGLPGVASPWLAEQFSLKDAHHQVEVSGQVGRMLLAVGFELRP